MRKLVVGLLSFELLVGGAACTGEEQAEQPLPLDIFGEPIISPADPNCAEALVEGFLDDWSGHMDEEDTVVGTQNSDEITQMASDMAEEACREAPDSVDRLTLGMRAWNCHSFAGRAAVQLNLLGDTTQGKVPYVASGYPEASFGPLPPPESGQC